MGNSNRFELFSRRALSLVLFLLFAFYFRGRWRMSEKGIVATSNEEEERTEFEFPSLAVCSQNASIVEVGQAFVGRDPWLYMVSYPNGTRRFDEGLEEIWSSPPLWERRKAPLPGVPQLQCHEYKPPRGMRSSYGRIAALYMTVDVSNMGSTGLSNFLVMGGPVGGAVPTLELFGSGVANLELTRKQGGVNLPMTLLLSVDFGRWTRLPTDERPCLEDEERSEMNSRLRRCFDNYLSTKLGCNSTVKDCSEAKLGKFEEFYANVSKWGESRFIRETGCVPACTTDTFSVSVDHSVPVESDESSSAVLYFNAPRPIFTVKTDYPAYDTASMLGDVAGMGGVLLGLSVLSAYDCLLGAALRQAKCLKCFGSGEKPLKTRTI